MHPKAKLGAVAAGAGWGIVIDGSTWILSTNFWVDGGAWDDAETWND